MPTPTTPAVIKAGVTPADIQREIDDASKAAANRKPIEGNLSTFLKGFAGAPQSDGTIKQGETPPPDDQQQVQTPPQSRQEPRQDPSKRQGYVKTLEAEKAALAEEKTQLTKERDDLNTKITDLSTQLAGAKTQKDIDSILSERDKVIEERNQTLAKMQDEVKTLKSRVTLYDLGESEDFQREFVQPITQTSRGIMEMVEGNQPALDKLTQVGSLNQAWLTAQNPEEKRRYQDQRDQLIYEIGEEIPIFRKDQFISSMRTMVDLSRKRQDAITNHEQTFQTIQQRNAQIREEAARKTVEQWTGAFQEVSQDVDSQTAIPDTVASFMSANNIVVDNALDEMIASASIKDGAKDYSPRDVARILKQGGSFKKVAAHAAALQKMLDEAMGTIAQLKGTGTRGGGTGGEKSSSQKGEDKKAAFFAKFQPTV